MKLQFDANQGLFGEIKAMIEQGRRAEYGKQIVSMRNIKNPADGGN